MNISIVIPNYNGAELLEKNIPKVIDAFKDYNDGKIEIIVIDDASTDNSLDKINNKNIVILKNEKNLGFSSTVNKGVAKATGEIVILLNTDVYPEQNFLKPLLKHFDDENIFAVGCLDKSIEGDSIIERGRGLGRWQRGFLMHRKGEVDKTNTLWVSGGSGAFRKSIWDKLGGLNELYNPFYWEDIDVSYRALKSGYKIMFEPKSVVFHEHEKGAIKSKFSDQEVNAIAYRNQFIFVKENATDANLVMEHFIWLPYHFLKAFLRRDKAFFIGYFKYLSLMPKIISSSIRYRKTFVKTDKEVISEFI